ncbi:hypothetical protein AVEN_78139-1, partial [Araneus ventricosus]
AIQTKEQKGVGRPVRPESVSHVFDRCCPKPWA